MHSLRLRACFGIASLIFIFGTNGIAQAQQPRTISTKVNVVSVGHGPRQRWQGYKEPGKTTLCCSKTASRKRLQATRCSRALDAPK